MQKYMIDFQGENVDSLPSSLAVDIFSAYIQCQENTTFMMQLFICRSETAI